MKKLVLTLLISSLIITVSPAQKHGSSGIPKIKKWSVAMYLGWNTGGPCKQIEDAMVTSGFGDDTGPGWFSSSGVKYPLTHKGISWMISVKRYLKYPFSIGIFAGNIYYGETKGRMSSVGYLSIKCSAFSVAPIISINSYDIISIGIGPSFYLVKASKDTYSSNGENNNLSKTKLGFLIDFGLRIPKKSRFFFELNAQYRYVGKAEIGPFTAGYDNTETLPNISVNYNHLFIGCGFGVRF